MTSQATEMILLGGGYTLERLAASLPVGSFVLTSRSAEKCAEWTRRGWYAFQADVRERSDVKRLFEAYASARILIDGVPPLREGEPDLGVANVCEAIATSHIERIVYLSTTGVFGVRDGSWVDENTPAKPAQPQGAARYMCERRYRDAARSCTALRVPAIYGPGRGIVESMRSGTYRIIGDGMRYSNRIHVDDLVRVIHAAATCSSCPDVLCVGDDEPALARDIVEFVCSKTGLAWPPSMSEEEAEKRGSYTMLSNQRIKNGVMKQLLGTPLHFPTYREGLIGNIDG